MAVSIAVRREVVVERRCEAVSAFVIATAMEITMPRMNITTTISTSVKPRAGRGSERPGIASMAAVMIPSAPFGKGGTPMRGRERPSGGGNWAPAYAGVTRREIGPRPTPG